MEKAYAKVCGSYANMNAGSVSEALMDFTGGIHMTFKLNEAPADLWDIMFRAARSKSLMGCGTPAGYHIKLEALKGECANDNDKNLLVSLMQKSDKRNRHLDSNFNIGFSIFSVR
ncbi:hypothetical protein AALO_G00248590 [Alosa alosa]|uniref:Calpain catalytic domain-containing protein n=1 Tax=Alosa alosa TaxID=278164 RepID=A0AAV6FTE9_9TELE|nr:hypothetical protein AALO_G00248590 [Alosa alosa]